MCHCDSRTIAGSPALVRESERRSRTGDRIYFRITAIVCINCFRQHTPFTHCLCVESRVLIPGNFHFCHEERVNRYIAYRCFVFLMECFFARTTHFERSARYGNHIEGYRSSGNLFSVIGERGNRCCCFEVQAGVYCCSCICSGDTGQFAMRIVRIIVSGVEVTTDTLQIQFFFVFVIIKVSSDSILVNPFRKQVLMTFFTGFVRNIFNGMFQFRLGVPVEIRTVFCHEGPYVFQSQFGFSRIMIPCVALGRKVTSHTMCFNAAPVIYVFGEFPAVFYMRMNMAHHTGFIGGEVNRCFVYGNHDACTEK